MIPTTWVFDGVEVVKTGREATREVGRTTLRSGRVLSLVEIKPLDESIEWKKWVSPDHLYVVTTK